jgi:hypothetical protein
LTVKGVRSTPTALMWHQVGPCTAARTPTFACMPTNVKKARTH